MASDELPVRPHVPASACAALGALATSAVMLESAWRGYVAVGRAVVAPPVFVACVFIAVTSGIVTGLLRSRRTVRLALRWLAVGVVASTISSVLWVASWNAHCDAVADADLGTCRFIVQDDPSVSAYGVSVTAKVIDAVGAALGAVRLTVDEAYDAGTELSLTARRKALDASDWARSRFMKGEVGSVDAVRVREVRSGVAFGPIGWMRRVVLEAIGPARSDARALIAGIVCGRVTELNQITASDDFATTGLTHLVAVSGSHLAFIAMLLQGTLHRLRVRSAVRAGVLIAIMAAYVVFTGCSPSAVRSVAMVTCGMLATLGERRAHPLSSLAITVAVLVVADPGVTFDLGFQLSAASVLFILVFGRYLACLLGKLLPFRTVAEALSLALAAQWATIPLTVPVFGTLSLISPLANLLAGPVMSALLVTGLIAVPLCAFMPVFGFFMSVPEGLANVSIFLAGLLAKVPFAAVPISCTVAQLLPCYALAVPVYLFWFDWKRRQLVVGLALATAVAVGHLVRWTLFAPASITVLDVGQADSILIRDGRFALLVDAGVDDEVLTALARNRVYRLDAVVVTHWDRDHWGGLPDVLGTVDVGRVIVSEGAAASLPEDVGRAFSGEVMEMRDGDTLHVGDFACEMVWPVAPVTGEENADSLCLDVSYRSGGRALDALLTGDAECDELDRFAREVGDIDLLKVGHHGSKVSVDESVLGALEPELAIASAGAGNRYGHPSKECVEAVEDSRAAFLCTIDAGDVTVYPGEDGIRVKTARTVPQTP